VIGPIGSGVDPAAVRGELEAARTARPLTLPEIRERLRDIFLDSATPARLGALMRAAGLPEALVGGRQLGVLVSLSDAAQAGQVAAALLAQRLRPAEVVAACAPAAADTVRAALGPLADQGMRIAVTGTGLTDAGRADAGRAGAGVDWARPLARLATAPWLAPWPADARPAADYLLDLACARECAQADAVGLYSGKHGAVTDYEFTRWLDQPALVRAQLLAPGGPAAGDWGSHGLRLLTITP
jgi:hypothetical protein